MEYTILDLASLRYQRNTSHTRLTVYTALREVLAVLDVPPGLDERECAFLGCEAVLERSRLVRNDPVKGRVRSRVAFYNPYSGEVSVGAVPSTIVYSDESPLSVQPSGISATLGEEAGVPVLRVAHRRLLVVQADFRSLSRTFAAHRH